MGYYLSLLDYSVTQWKESITDASRESGLEWRDLNLQSPDLESPVSGYVWLTEYVP